MTAWSSLFIPSNTRTVIQVLQESLTALDYELFNPFGMVPGKAYRHAIRLFVAPLQGDWVRVIGQLDRDQLPHISQIAPCLYLILNGENAEIDIYASGGTADTGVFTGYLRAGCSFTDLTRAASGKVVINPASADDSVLSEPDRLPIDYLPDDLQSLAGKVDLSKAQKLFDRFKNDLLRKGGQTDDLADAAHELIAASHPPQWDSEGGLRIRSLVECLTIPDGWRDPDFTTLRDAYQVHERRQRKPKSMLLPGDAELMVHVANALDYTPVYGGKND